MGHDSDSSVQRRMEGEMLAVVDERNPDWKRLKDWKCVAGHLKLDERWQKAKPDAVWRKPDRKIVIAECYARVEKLKSGHKNKLAKDALKLHGLKSAAKGQIVKCLLIVPEELKETLNRSTGWLSHALSDVAHINPVRLRDEQRSALKAATAKQAKGQGVGA